MWSISGNIQRLVHQQSQQKIQWSMLRKGTFRHYRQANKPNQQSAPHDDVIKLIKERAAWKQNGLQPWERCAACDPQRSLQRGKADKLTSYAMKRRRNGLRIM